MQISPEFSKKAVNYLQNHKKSNKICLKSKIIEAFFLSLHFLLLAYFPKHTLHNSHNKNCKPIHFLNRLNRSNRKTYFTTLKKEGKKTAMHLQCNFAYIRKVLIIIFIFCLSTYSTFTCITEQNPLLRFLPFRSHSIEFCRHKTKAMHTFIILIREKKVVAFSFILFGLHLLCNMLISCFKR